MPELGNLVNSSSTATIYNNTDQAALQKLKADVFASTPSALTDSAVKAVFASWSGSATPCGTSANCTVCERGSPCGSAVGGKLLCAYSYVACTAGQVRRALGSNT